MGLPLDGGINTLTKEQKISLKECWKYWFDLLSDAPAIGTIQKEPIAATQPKGLTDEEIGVWKSEQETITSKAALVRLGSDELNRLFWLAVGIENVDALLLRFLRARKWSITAAVNMMLACLQWRSGFGVERIFTKGEEGMNIDGIKQLKVGKTYTQGTDRFGRPVLYVHVKNHRTNDQDAKALE